MSSALARLALSAYRWVGLGLYPVMQPYLAIRAAKGKEERGRRGERFGHASVERPAGPLVWVHAASVGETNALRRASLSRATHAHVYDPAREQPSGVDLVIDAVGAKATRNMALAAVKPGGVVMHVGLMDWASEIDMRRLTLAEIKEMVEAEEVREELRATYRPDLEVSERIKRYHKRIEVTQRQFDIISTKLTAMIEMKKELDERLARYHKNLSELDDELRLAEARSSS